MNKKSLSIVAFLLGFLLFGAASSYAIPSSFCDDYDGFLEFNVIWSWDFSGKGPALGAEFGGGGEGFWGIDFGIVAYPSHGLFAYAGGQYFVNPTVSDFYTIPVRLRIGAVIQESDVSWGVSALAGIKLYPLVFRYDEENEEDLALAAGVAGSLNYWNGSFFSSGEADASFAMSLAPSSGSGYYYYYY